jgi:cold shock CspA family protein
MKGIIVSWGPHRKWGFTTTTKGQNIFTHVNEFLDIEKYGLPKVGQILSFSIIKYKGKLQAMRIVRLHITAANLMQEMENT